MSQITSRHNSFGDSSLHGVPYYQHLFKGPNFSQISKQQRVASSSFGGVNQQNERMMVGYTSSKNNSRARVISATSQTATGSRGQTHGRSNAETMLRASKPTIDNLGFTSIKSSIKSDPMSRQNISNSISTECLNAHKMRGHVKPVNGSQGRFHLVSNSGEHNLKQLGSGNYNRVSSTNNQGAQTTYHSFSNVQHHAAVNLSQLNLQPDIDGDLKIRNGSHKRVNSQLDHKSQSKSQGRLHSRGARHARPLNKTKSSAAHLSQSKIQTSKHKKSAQFNSFSGERVATEGQRTTQFNEASKNSEKAGMATECDNEDAAHCITGTDANQDIQFQQQYQHPYQSHAQSIPIPAGRESHAETPLSAEINVISPTMNMKQLSYSEREGINGNSFYLGDIKKDTNPISEADLMSPIDNSNNRLREHVLPQTSAKMGPLLSSSPDHTVRQSTTTHNEGINNQALDHQFTAQAFNLNSPDFIQSNGHTINANDAAALRSSVVYLRDEGGNYYQMNEDLYMQLQLDQVQKSVHNAPYDQQPSELAGSSNQAPIGTLSSKRLDYQIQNDLQTRQRPNSSLQKKASLVVNLTKPWQKVRESQKNNKHERTLRNNSDMHNTFSYQPNSSTGKPSVTFQQTSASQGIAAHQTGSYQPNQVTINGINYIAVSLKDIPHNTQIVASLAKDVQTLIKSMRSLPAQEAQPMAKSEEDEVASYVKQFKVEQKQFTQCMRSFSSKQNNMNSQAEQEIQRALEHQSSSSHMMMQNQHQQKKQILINHASPSEGQQDMSTRTYMEQKQLIQSPHGLMRNLNEQQKSAPMVVDPEAQQALQQQFRLGQDHNQDHSHQLHHLHSGDMTIIHNQLLNQQSDQIPTQNMNSLDHLASNMSNAVDQQFNINPIGMQSNDNSQETTNRIMTFNYSHAYTQQNQSASKVDLSSSAYNPKSLTVKRNSGIQQHFLTQDQYNNLKQGQIQKAFVTPTTFKTGNKFANKSEEARFLKQFDPIIKLRHILLNDKDRARVYTRQVLGHYFTPKEIENFSELGIMNFQDTVKQMSFGPIDMSVKNLILSAIDASRLPLTDASRGKNTHHSQAIEQSLRASLQASSNNDCIYNFEVDNGFVTSLGLNSGKRLLMQQQEGTKQQQQDPEQLKQTQAGLVLIQTKKAGQKLQDQQASVSKSQTFMGRDKRNSRQHKSQQNKGIYLVQNNYTTVQDQMDFGSSEKQTFASRKNSRSPTVNSLNRGNNQQHIVCKNMQKPQIKQTAPEKKKVKKDIKGKRGFSCKYSKSVKRDIYFNPLSKGDEVFVQRQDIPDLIPIWDEDKSDARLKVYNFLNSQNLRLATEIEPTSCSNLVKSMNRNTTTLVSEINEKHPKIKELKTKHTKDGIMRRNGLLLEHIMYDRFHKDQETS